MLSREKHGEKDRAEGDQNARTPEHDDEEYNPFEYNTPVTSYELAKMVFMYPVAIKYRYKHFNPAYVCTRAKDYFHRRHFTQFVQHLEVVFLPVHYPTEAEKEDPTLFANAVRDEIAKELGARTTNHYFEDCKLFQAALDRRQAKHVLAPLEKRRPIDNVFLNGLQVKEIKDIFGDSGSHLSEIKAALKVFEAFDTNEDSNIDYEEFCKATGCPSESSLSKILFDFCDRDDSGTINFRDLVLSMALTSAKATSEEKARLVFRLLDSDEDGLVSGDDVRNLLELSQGGEYKDAEAVEPEIKQIFATANEKGAKQDSDGEPLLDWELFRELIQDKPALVNCAISKVKTKQKFPDFDAPPEEPSPQTKSKKKTK
ncbi:Lysophosphatidylcholine acyltransferase 2 [Hondaea fermentalgiana]|uniref:Lysophosphatidylcholine acyltransferase 2 n=1 Tax=Hondaea fermentalgiana TaxID=2315210 RepID=A0A2R5GCV5_9STRA|nr:Lysophosphatidylcholine acyltransferase 2 [Hondaea fermentalgiana]|eukprot:GBG28807.1 Lysophosphatidylcholine acyltransferase 2 [Hondaea fermentalgiana]